MIENVIDVLIIIIMFSTFGFLHSFLASNKVKKYLTDRLGNLIAFYRFFYVVTSLLLFYFIYGYAPDGHIIVYDLKPPFDLIILIPQFLGLAGLLWSIKYFYVKEFLGVNQIIRWQNNQYDTNELDEHLTLRIAGPYKYCRHPVYLFSIVFLIFRSEMDLNYLTFLICITAYFYVGSFFEENKLVERFGAEYIHYQQTVPRIFPLKLGLYKKRK